MHSARLLAGIAAALLLVGAGARAGAQSTTASILVTATIASAAGSDVATLTSLAAGDRVASARGPATEARYDLVLRVDLDDESGTGTGWRLLSPASVAVAAQLTLRPGEHALVARGLSAAEALALSRRIRVVAAGPATVRVRVELTPVGAASR